MSRERLAERVGNRYFLIDRGYDKKVYENDFANYVRIILTFIGFYTFNTLHFWACFELGVNAADIAMWYFVAVFTVTVLIGAVMLISGRSSNRKKMRKEFYEEKIEEAKTKKREAEQLERKQREREANLAAKKAAGKQREDHLSAGGPDAAGGFYTSINHFGEE